MLAIFYRCGNQIINCKSPVAKVNLVDLNNLKNELIQFHVEIPY